MAVAGEEADAGGVEDAGCVNAASCVEDAADPDKDSAGDGKHTGRKHKLSFWNKASRWQFSSM